MQRPAELRPLCLPVPVHCCAHPDLPCLLALPELRSSTHSLNRNVFVESTLGYVLSYISTCHPSAIRSVSITILADNDYYSHADASRKTSEAAPRFLDFGVPLHKAHKTGLGSSAALVTALTAALLVQLLPPQGFSISSDAGKAIIHNLAQTAHCAAQGKIGSGFDVASAVYGSCVYRRFSPSLLSSHGEPGKPGFAKELKSLVEDADPSRKWDAEITKPEVTLPQGLRLVMCDVDCGSRTPAMVKGLLAWREQNKEAADRIWKQLQETNENLQHELVKIDREKRKDYGQPRNIIADIRTLVRNMSSQSGVPIEPLSQQKLLDACSQVPGVIGGVVPGAGGYDAIALIIEDRAEVTEALQGLLEKWQPVGDESGATRASHVRMLHVREEMEGARSEDTAVHKDWLS